MTGTALTEAEEFFDIYKLNVISVPTNKNMERKDLNDEILEQRKEKYEAITKKIIQCKSKGQPVLVGTTSIEKSEKISDFLKKTDTSQYIKCKTPRERGKYNFRGWKIWSNYDSYQYGR